MMAKQTNKQIEYLKIGYLWAHFIDGADFSTAMAGTSIIADEAIYEEVNEKRLLLPYLDKTDSMGIVAVLEKPAKYWQVHSVCPVFEGTDAQVTIENTVYNQEDGFGFVRFSIDGIDIKSLTARNPFFMANKNFINQGKTTVKLAALGFRVEKTPKEPIRISSGKLYEMCLKDFLAEHPDKTKKDYPFVEISTRKSTGFLPWAYEDSYEFQANILSVKKLTFLDYVFYRLEIDPIRDIQNEKKQNIFLYVSAERLDNYKPRKGDNIRGRLALIAYVDKLPNKSFEVKSWKNVTTNTILKQIYDGANVNKIMPTDKDLRRPLEAAIIEKSDKSVIELLLQSGASIQQLHKRVYSAINDKWLLDIFIKAGIDLHSLLAGCVASGNLSLVKYLLKLGADIHGDNFYNDTKRKDQPIKDPVIIEASKPEIIDYLISIGADVNEYSSSATTALYEAVCRSWVTSDTINCLIKHGADINAINGIKKSQTALHGICANCTKFANHEQIIECLLNAGADPVLMDYNENRAIDYAKKNLAIKKSSRTYKRLKKLSVIHTAPEDLELIHAVRDCKDSETIKDLLTKVKDINAYDDDCMTALLYCVQRNGDPETLKLLIDAGADINQKDKRGFWPPIRYATYYYGYEHMLPMLIKAGADLNATAGFGSTALMCAVDDVPVNKPLKLLLDAGADITIKDKGGYTDPFICLIDNIALDKENKNDRKYDWVGALELLLEADKNGYANNQLYLKMYDYLDKKAVNCHVRSETDDILYSHFSKHWNIRWQKHADELMGKIEQCIKKNKNVSAELFITAVSDGIKTSFIKKIIPFVKNINAKDRDGRTALHRCAMYNATLDTLKLLIKSGASLKVKDKEGRIPYDCISDYYIWEEDELPTVKGLLDPKGKNRGTTD